MGKKYYVVYTHISPNNKRYIGITSLNPNKRWKNGKGYKTQPYFWRAINKYGWDNFEHIIIAKRLDEETAKWLEIELIREWNTTNKKYGYNQTLGGDGVNGYKHTEERLEKISKATSGEKNPMCGNHHTEKTKEKMSEKKKDIYNGKNNPNAKKVMCVELEITFDTINEAAAFVNRSQNAISQVLKSGGKSGGYHWKYVKKEVGE